jgi:CDP-diacylglycerol--serine O-phosphatidyltransferase
MSIKNHVPNAITCLNLFFGCIAVVMAFRGLFFYALLFVILAAVFDFFDGFAARLLHASSPIGKELDSLADMVSFGVAPSVVVFTQLSWLDGAGICASSIRRSYASC